MPFNVGVICIYLPAEGYSYVEDNLVISVCEFRVRAT